MLSEEFAKLCAWRFTEKRKEKMKVLDRLIWKYIDTKSMKHLIIVVCAMFLTAIDEMR